MAIVAYLSCSAGRTNFTRTNSNEVCCNRYIQAFRLSNFYIWTVCLLSDIVSPANGQTIWKAQLGLVKTKSNVLEEKQILGNRGKTLFTVQKLGVADKTVLGWNLNIIHDIHIILTF